MKKTATEAALAGGKILMDYFSKENKVEVKTSKRDIITEADEASEKAILLVLKNKFPEHNFNSEEQEAKENNSEYTWIIDPLDGTINYASKNFLFSISIALKKKNEIILSVIYVPFTSEMFVAEKGKGATLNGNEIKSSFTGKIEDSTIILSPGYKTSEKIGAMKKIISDLMTKARSILIIGSTPLALAFIACGRADAYITYKSDVYNMAAGSLLIQEADGKVIDFNGDKFDIESEKLNVIASGGGLSEELLERISALGF